MIPNVAQLEVLCDASSYGVGAVIVRVENDGARRPIVFEFRMLSPSKRNYSHLEREALAIVFGIKKLHYYI